MRIAVIGMGNVGGALARRWVESGHEVTFGARDPADAKALAAAKGAGAAVKAVAAAAAGAEVVVLAVPWPAVADAVRSAGDLRGKVLLDCTNPLTADLSGLEVGTTTSGGEVVARAAPGARVVKIFNTSGSGNMANANYGANKPTMLHAGDDPQAKAVAARLASDIGFAPVDLGPLTAARLLEPFALVWITLALRGGQGPDFVLNIVRRPAT
jgi:predicted dinucleotide-binding enzyme